MLCQKCQKNVATIRIVNVNGNHKEEKFLCEECAAQSGELKLPFTSTVALSDFWPKLFTASESQTESIRCSACGWTLQDMEKTGYWGCSQCYSDFASTIRPLLARIHGATQHKGKVPDMPQKASNQRYVAMKKLDELRQKMSVAIKEENFEQAAKLRDQIKLYETKLSSDSVSKEGSANGK